MDVTRISRRFVYGLASVAIILGANSVHSAAPDNIRSYQNVGTLAGQLSVNQGSAHYSVPIDLPEGVAGVKPELAFSYAQDGGNGLLGVGWTLSGLSQISRCARTKAQDGARGTVGYNWDDRYCLDGQRLSQISAGYYGKEGSEYRTEINGQSKILSYGKSGSGPESFKVWTKSGLVYEYGSDANSRLIVPGSHYVTANTVKSWWVNKITDTNGNSINFIYTKDDAAGVHQISEISYGGNKVQFFYQSRNDVKKYHYRSSVTSLNQRLRSIDVRVGSRLLTRYELGYKYAELSGMSRLVAISQKDRNGIPLPPMKFEWEPETTAFSSQEKWAFSAGNHFQYRPSWKDGSQRSAFIDINGDGLPDRVNHYNYSTQQPGLWVALNTGKGFGPLTNWGLPATHNDQFNPTRINDNEASVFGMFIDLNGDGLQDRVEHYNHDTQQYGMWVALNTGTGFGSLTNWGLPATHNNQFRPTYLNDDGSVLSSFIDINGDGLPDRVNHYNYDVDQYGMWVSLNTGSGFEPLTKWSLEVTHINQYRPTYLNDDGSEFSSFVDINADGLPDRVNHYNHSTGQYGLWVALNNKNGFQPLQRWNFPAAHINQNRPKYLNDDGSVFSAFIDINGDGLPDRVNHHNHSNGQYGMWVSLNTGSSFGPLTKWTMPTTHQDQNRPTYLNDDGSELSTFQDVNGDGLLDRVNHYNHSHGQYGLWVALNNGSGFDNLTRWDIPVTTSHQSRPTSVTDGGDVVSEFRDMNGDGFVDRVNHYNYSNGEYGIWVSLNQGYKNDIVAFEDSLGARLNLVYSTLTDSSVYSPGLSEEPMVDVKTSKRVVKQTQKDNAQGGVTKTSYKYSGAAIDRNGRGFLGFKWEEVKDEQTGVTTRTDYHQDFPFVGMPVSVVTTAPNGVELSKTENEYLPKALNNNATVFPYLSKKIETVRDYNTGNLVSTVTTTQDNYDDYGNVKDITVTTVTEAGANHGIAAETFTKTTENTYSNEDKTVGNVVYWHLGRLTHAKVIHSKEGTTGSLARESSFTYDETTGLLLSETIEPSNQQGLGQTTTYTYDSFGNKKKVTVTAGATSRTTRTEYDPDELYGVQGRFATKVINALGHQETRAYDTLTGKVTSLTGPNGLTTSWQYDSLGRKTLETRADGNTTSITRGWVGVSSSEADLHAPSAVSAYYYVKTETSGSPATYKYYDKLGRVVRKMHRGFAGEYIYQDTDYDSRGREIRSTMPYVQGETVYWVHNEFDAIDRNIGKRYHNGSHQITKNISYNGLITTETNALGQTKTTIKNGQGKVVEVIEEEGGRVTYDYDAIGNLLATHQHDDANDKVVTVTMQYDVRGNKVSMHDPDMGEWDYSYNGFGELVNQTDAKGQTVTMEYDALGRMIKRIDNDSTTEWLYDTAAKGIGKLASVSQTDGTSTLYSHTVTYDSLGRTIGSSRSFEGKTFSSSTEYDPFGRVFSTTTTPDAQNSFTLENVYNDYGYLKAKRSPLPMQAGDIDHLTTLRDEAAARAQIAIDAVASYAATLSVYEEYAELFQSLDQQASAHKIIESPGYDSAVPYNRFTKAGSNDHYIRGSDSNGNLHYYRLYYTTLTRSRQVLASHDGWVLINVGGIETPIPRNPVYNTEYYNETGWVLSELSVPQWEAAGVTATNEAVYFGDFNTDGYSDFVTAKEGLDPRDIDGIYAELATIADDIRAAAAVLETQYNNAATLAAQLVVVADNLADRVRQAQLWADASAEGTLNDLLASADSYTTWWQASARDTAGRLTAFRHGNGLVTVRDYDPGSGQLNVITTGFEYGSNLLRNLEYEYDALDNVTAKHDMVQGTSESFSYDGLNRLTHSSLSGNIDGIDFTNPVSYSYDALGNITNKSDVGNYTYNPLKPHAVESAGSHSDFVYDANGSLISSGTGDQQRNVTWTSFNKPSSFSKGDDYITFTYGPERARYKKTKTQSGSLQETTLYMGKAYERVEDAVSGDVKHKYFIYADDGELTAIHVETEKADGTVTDESRYMHRDALGSIDLITDTTGNEVQRMGYTPFGARRSIATSTRYVELLGFDPYTNRGFTGHEHVDIGDIGLIHMNGRVYDPQLGRFLSADPHVQFLHASQSYNRYSYVMNNPLKYTDPSGYFLSKLFKAITKPIRATWKAYNDVLNSIFRAIASNKYLNFIAQTAACTFGGSIGCAAYAGRMTYAQTGSFSASLKAAVMAYGTAEISNRIGMKGKGKDAWTRPQQAVAHGVVGGVRAELSGGKFHQGFASSFFTKMVSGKIAESSGSESYTDRAIGTVKAAIVGGTISVVSGGKFSNGANTAAMQYLFNEISFDIWNAENVRGHGGYMEPVGEPYEGKHSEGDWITGNGDSSDFSRTTVVPRFWVTILLEGLTANVEQYRTTIYGQIQDYQEFRYDVVFDLKQGTRVNVERYSHTGVPVAGTRVSRNITDGRIRKVIESRKCYLLFGC